MRFVVLAFLCLLAAGCTTTQLSYGTVNVASTIEEIETNQALANFARIAEEKYAVPSLVSFTGGTVQVVNSFSPSVTFPLTSMAAQVSSSSPSSTSTKAGSGATLSGTVSWQQNFNIVPVTDQFTLRNLAVLYRAVVHCNSDAPGAELGHTQYAVSNSAFVYQPPRMYAREDLLVPDPYYLENPNCVLCLKNFKDPPQSDAELLTKTKPNELVFGKCWLYHRKITEPEDSRTPSIEASKTRYLGRSGTTVFYIEKDSFASFSMFLVLTLPVAAGPTRFANVASVQKTTPPPAAGGGKGKGPTESNVTIYTVPFQLYGSPEGVTRPSVILPTPGILNNPQ